MLCWFDRLQSYTIFAFIIILFFISITSSSSSSSSYMTYSKIYKNNLSFFSFFLIHTKEIFIVFFNMMCHLSSFIYYLIHICCIHTYMHTYRWYYIDKSYLNIVCAYFFLKTILLSSTLITRTNADSIDFSSINDICILHFYFISFHFISFHHLFILEKRLNLNQNHLYYNTYIYDIECISKWNEFCFKLFSILLFLFFTLKIYYKNKSWMKRIKTNCYR
jgi:hypothetical protein